MAQMVGVFRIGNEPTLRYTQDGTPVLGLSLACNYGQKGDDGRRPTQWYDCALWGKRAEALEPYLHKGDAVYVILSDVHLETFRRQDQTTGTKIVARISEIELLGGNNSGEQQQGQQQQRQGNGANEYARQTGREPAPPRRQEPKPQPRMDDLDDDIPF
ncbi:MAG TPA: single-stranded DNA-binding protein [Fluviicoccus sp.]|nr:single-stranded DNA-binding protein [Fluviicoccus sp.]